MTAEMENVALYLRREHVSALESWTLRKSTQYSPAGRERMSAAVLCYTHTFKNITYYYYYNIVIFLAHGQLPSAILKEPDIIRFQLIVLHCRI